MSAYKEPLEWIKESIDSILNQTFCDFEFIIVDDNPEDKELLAFLKEYEGKDGRIHILQNEQNRGLPYCLNKAIDHSRGVYIARMDADDIAMPKRLSMQYDYLEQHTDILVCGCWARRFGKISFWSDRCYCTPENYDEIKICALFQSPMIHPSVMARREVMVCHKYDESLRKAQDYDLWCRLIQAGCKMHNITSCLLRYRITEKSLSLKARSEQGRVADDVRSRLLATYGIPHTTDEVLLHNSICKCQKCDVDVAEEWMLKLYRFFKRKTPDSIQFLNVFLGSQWFLFMLLINQPFYRFLKSEVPHKLSLGIILRFVKRFFIYL